VFSDVCCPFAAPLCRTCVSSAGAPRSSRSRPSASRWRRRSRTRRRPPSGGCRSFARRRGRALGRAFGRPRSRRAVAEPLAAEPADAAAARRAPQDRPPTPPGFPRRWQAPARVGTKLASPLETPAQRGVGRAWAKRQRRPSRSPWIRPSPLTDSNRRPPPANETFAPSDGARVVYRTQSWWRRTPYCALDW
jgi:hypothetical protein